MTLEEIPEIEIIEQVTIRAAEAKEGKRGYRVGWPNLRAEGREICEDFYDAIPENAYSCARQRAREIAQLMGWPICDWVEISRLIAKANYRF